MRMARLLALATLVAMVGLSACGSSSGPSSNAASTTTSITSTSTTVPGPTTTMVLDDIPYYANGTTLDAFLPDPRPARPIPAVVLVHGGGWVGGERGEWAPWANRLVLEQGWAAFSIDYVLVATTPQPWPGEFHDVQAAIRFVAANAAAFGIDPQRIAVLGESAGGNLTALISSLGTGRPVTGSPVGTAGVGQQVPGRTVRGAALTYPSPTLEVPVVAVGLWSAPTELAPLAPPAPGQPAPGCGTNAACEFAWDDGDVVRYLGCRPSACPAKYAETSPLDQVSASTVPSFVSNATDELIPVAQAIDYAAALKAAGVPHQLKIVPGNLHALQTADAVWDDTIAFLARYLDRR
ncbi:MAG: alpha/beta hydrolase [Acidimicrobiia bacterium]